MPPIFCAPKLGGAAAVARRKETWATRASQIRPEGGPTPCPTQEPGRALRYMMQEEQESAHADAAQLQSVSVSLVGDGDGDADADADADTSEAVH